MKGFLLGLANGTVCLAYCAPVLIPYIIGEGQTVRRNYFELAEFLFGRLLGYLLFAILAWSLGLLVSGHNVIREKIFAVSYCLLAVFLVYYSFRKSKSLCAIEYFKGTFHRWFITRRDLFPVSLGFLTGLNLCPPFLLAFTSAVSGGSLTGSLIFFSAFFAGTSIYFIPLPFLGLLKRTEVLRIIGKMAAGIIGAYYFYMGMIILIGGNLS